MIESVLPSRLARGRHLTAALAVLASALRVRQWTKNLLLFAGLVFAAKLGDPVRWGDAWLAFAAYCAASSAAYLVNDVRDAETRPASSVQAPASGGERATVARARRSWLSAALCAAAVAAASALGFRPWPCSQASSGSSSRTRSASSGSSPSTSSLSRPCSRFAPRRARRPSTSVSRRGFSCAPLCWRSSSRWRNEAASSAPSATQESGAARVLARYSLACVDRLLVVVGARDRRRLLRLRTGRARLARSGRHDPVRRVRASAGTCCSFRRDGVGETPEEILLTDLPIQLTIVAWALIAAVVLMTT